MIGRYRNLGYTVPKRFYGWSGHHFSMQTRILGSYENIWSSYSPFHCHHIPHFLEKTNFSVTSSNMWNHSLAIRINTLEMGVPSCPTLDIFDVGKLTELSCISSSKGNILNYYIILSNICSIENYLDITCLYQLCHLEIITFDISSIYSHPNGVPVNRREIQRVR